MRRGGGHRRLRFVGVPPRREPCTILVDAAVGLIEQALELRAHRRAIAVRENVARRVDTQLELGAKLADARAAVALGEVADENEVTRLAKNLTKARSEAEKARAVAQAQAQTRHGLEARLERLHAEQRAARQRLREALGRHLEAEVITLQERYVEQARAIGETLARLQAVAHTLTWTTGASSEGAMPWRLHDICLSGWQEAPLVAGYRLDLVAGNEALRRELISAGVDEDMLIHKYEGN